MTKEGRGFWLGFAYSFHCQKNHLIFWQKIFLELIISIFSWFTIKRITIMSCD